VSVALLDVMCSVYGAHSCECIDNMDRARDSRKYCGILAGKIVLANIIF
jgi:hypothetical protein